jgi:tRNA(fMet)-specific endonuclease VapC
MESRIVCLDTSIFIEYFRKKQKENTIFFKLSETNSKLVTTSISKFEILRGSNASQQSFWNIIFEKVETLPFALPFDDETSVIASSVYQDLKKSNRLIDPPDLFIASVALQHHLPIVTLNEKDFLKVNSLRLFRF